MKKNINKIQNPLEKIKKVNGVYFEWKEPEIRGSKKQVGVIAQELMEVLPEAVDYDEPLDAYSVNYSKITALNIEAIKALKDEIESLKKEIDSLKKQSNSN